MAQRRSAASRRTRGPLTNAGFESVNGSDYLAASGLPTATLDAEVRAELAALLARYELAGLVNPQLPLDLTPMAGEDAFLACG